MSEVSMPRGWMQAEIGKLCDLINGRAFKPDEWSDEGLPIIRIQNLNNPNAPFNHFGGELADKHRIRYGNLLFAWSGTPGTSFGAHVWKGGEAALNQHIFKVAFDESKIDKRFLLYAINQTLGELVAGAHGGVGLRHVTKGKFEKTRVAFPPLEEQKVIADKLDEMLAQVSNLEARLDAIPAILKRFRKSVLAAAVSGRLTESWRDDSEVKENASSLKKRWLETRRNEFAKLQKQLVDCGTQRSLKKFKVPVAADVDSLSIDLPKGWYAVSVSEYAECLDSYRVPVKKEKRAGSEKLYPYFGANGEVDRVDEYIFDDDLVMVTEDETFYGREKPIAYRYTGKCWVNNHAHVLRAPTKQANDYLCYSLMHYNVLPWLSGTTGRAKLTQAVLNSLPITLPPEAELNEIVRRVDQLFAFADQVEQQVKNARARVDKLTPSIHAKAFGGELTAEWRAANPELISGEHSAEALLERIKAEKEKLQPAKSRRARKPKQASMSV